ncbi:MAG: biotin/lipoyl-containing protein, partial [Persicimonas sp.]
MAEVVTMLALSPTMDEGTLVDWLKDEGDTVEEGEILAEVETDKATMEMESFFDGTLLKRLVEAGDAVPVGAPIAVIGEEGEDIEAVLDDLDGDTAAPEKQEAEKPEEDAAAEQEAAEKEQAAETEEAAEEGEEAPSPDEEPEEAAP